MLGWGDRTGLELPVLGLFIRLFPLALEKEQEEANFMTAQVQLDHL